MLSTRFSLLRSLASAATASRQTRLYNTILAEQKGAVGVITLNRKPANALCDELVAEITDAATKYDNDPTVGALVLTGSMKFFAAGADIKEMSGKSFPQTYSTDMLGQWQALSNIRKPVVGAINGFALGGGCELAMMCDILIAGEKAVFGQPEIKLGTIPGAGGTQRLTQVVGKSLAMELVLTGRFMHADEALRCGLVSRVVPTEDCLSEAMQTAETIASYSQPVAIMAKECVLASYNMGLNEGLRFEKRMFHSTFGMKDRKEGMSAFVEKREPKFVNE
jgi:enoyl-CoA hydratase/carnithine racemase